MPKGRRKPGSKGLAASKRGRQRQRTSKAHSRRVSRPKRPRPAVPVATEANDSNSSLELAEGLESPTKRPRSVGSTKEATATAAVDAQAPGSGSGAGSGAATHVAAPRVRAAGRANVKRPSAADAPGHALDGDGDVVMTPPQADADDASTDEEDGGARPLDVSHGSGYDHSLALRRAQWLVEDLKSLGLAHQVKTATPELHEVITSWPLTTRAQYQASVAAAGREAPSGRSRLATKVQGVDQCGPGGGRAGATAPGPHRSPKSHSPDGYEMHTRVEATVRALAAGPRMAPRQFEQKLRRQNAISTTRAQSRELYRLYDTVRHKTVLTHGAAPIPPRPTPVPPRPRSTSAAPDTSVPEGDPGGEGPSLTPGDPDSCVRKGGPDTVVLDVRIAMWAAWEALALMAAVVAWVDPPQLAAWVSTAHPFGPPMVLSAVVSSGPVHVLLLLGLLAALALATALALGGDSRVAGWAAAAACAMAVASAAAATGVELALMWLPRLTIPSYAWMRWGLGATLLSGILVSCVVGCVGVPSAQGSNGLYFCCRGTRASTAATWNLLLAGALWLHSLAVEGAHDVISVVTFLLDGHRVAESLQDVFGSQPAEQLQLSGRA